MRMTIGERLTAAAAFSAVFIAITGCISVGNGNGKSVVSTEGRESVSKLVTVELYPDGHLNAGSLYIGADQIPTLAKEVEGSTVQLRPVTFNGTSVTLEQATRVRDELLKHGVKRVILPMGN